MLTHSEGTEETNPPGDVTPRPTTRGGLTADLKKITLTLAMGSLSLLHPALVHSQSIPGVPGDFGDAPDGIRAYSNVNGFPVTGTFPTLRVGPNGRVFHSATALNANCYFGWTVDYEWDAASDPCLTSPYEQDEPSTINDCDAGLTGPEPYTIDANGIEVPMFDTVDPRPIGVTNEVAHWGQGPDDNVDIYVQNHTNAEAYVNVLVDWDQDGSWAPLPQAVNSELAPLAAAAPVIHGNFVLANWRIPAGFSGWLSALNPPPFVIGPNFGHVWARFTISNTQANVTSWQGSAFLTRGESSDFLWWVGGGSGALEGAELGDAPDGYPAYPTAGVPGNFPTCVSGVNGSVWHNIGNGIKFGSWIDFETDGNADNCSFSPYDNDELFMDPNGDAGLIWPQPWTISGGTEIPVGPGGQQDHDIGPACSLAAWGTDIDIQISNTSQMNAYVNVLFDWNVDGEWGGSITCGGNTVTEWELRNILIGPNFVGPLSAALPGNYPLPLGGEGFVWVRFTISEDIIQGNDWDGRGSFLFGETEDYLLHVGPMSTSAAIVDPKDTTFELSQNRPNPLSKQTRIAFQVKEGGAGRLDIFDVAGRHVKTLIEGDFEAGSHEVPWDVRDDSGYRVSDGIYLYRLTVGKETTSRRMVILNR